MKTKLLCAKTAMFALACFSSIGVWGQIKITDENGLKAIAENLNGDYVLENNITLSKEWEPIGTNDSPFTGTIDGKGFTIYGLKINRPEQNSVGFIGTAKIEDVSSTKVTVKNLRLVGVEIFGHQDVGAVIGNSYGAKVSECYTSGLVYGWDHTGGIIGGTKKVDDDDNIMTQVSNCYSNAAVVSSSYQAGGIIGASINSVVDRCYFSGVAVCPEGRSGGIVALNDGNSLTITNCVTLSSYIKAGSGDAGGANAILGADNPAEDSNAVSTISNSYSWSGLKLYENNVEIARSNNANDSYDGGYLDLDELKTAQFWLGDVNFDAGIWTMVENTYPSLSNVQVPLENYIYIPSFPERCLPGKTFNAEAIPASGRTITYTSSNPEIATIDSKGKVSFLKDGKTTLTFVDQGDNYVKGCTKTYELEVKGVAYTIMDEEDLRCVKYDLAGDFKLGADIYLTKDWELMDVFTGTLDGQGYTIHNLRYINEEQGRVGLFGEATGATIKRVGIAGAYLNGNEDVGAIVGYANGCNISECFVDQASYIAGRDHIGSIVGKVEKMEVEEEGSAEKVITGTTVSDCYSMAKVYSREYQAGGVVGVVNYGTVERCYFSGNIRATKGRAGGIFSLVDADGKVFVENNVCLASGIYCSEATYCIGENGRTSTATLTNNYVDHYASYKGTDLSSSAPSDVYDNASNNGEKLESDEVLSSEWYKETLGWDFDNIWTFIEGGEGNMYPILKCQQSKVLTPVIYGIPEPAFLIQLADGSSSESLNLERIKSTCGQKLIFKITKGEEYIYIDGTIVDFSGAKEVDGETVATISIAPEVEITGLKPFETTAFDINMVGQSHVFPINNVADLLDVNNKLFASFCLMNDIDMTGVEFEGFGSLESPFTGSFDGNGHTIKNPVVITNDDNTKGFFNATKGAKIKNLGISNFSFSGSQANGNKSTDLGGFAGSAKETTFDQCYLTGKVVGRDHVGGFVGGNCSNVTITNSFVNAEVFAYSQAGGFFGVAAGNVTMKNCYFAGSVKLNPSHSYGWVGGFVGLVDADCTVTIEDCVSIGNLQGSVASGSFIGANGGDQKNNPRGIINFTGNVFNFDAERFLMDGKISENDWESQGYVTKEGGVVESPIEHYATPVEDNEFLTQIPYNDAKFDFENIWTIDEEVSYPTLKNVAYIPAPPVGIEQVVDQNENIYIVYTSDNAIFVSGMKNTAKIALYNINGQLVSNVITSGENIELPIMGKGFYIVRIVEDEMTTTVKVVVK